MLDAIELNDCTFLFDYRLLASLLTGKNGASVVLVAMLVACDFVLQSLGVHEVKHSRTGGPSWKVCPLRQLSQVPQCRKSQATEVLHGPHRR